jgi:hypothetical protein
MFAVSVNYLKGIAGLHHDSVVEHLHSMYKALSSILSTTNKQNKTSKTDKQQQKLKLIKGIIAWSSDRLPLESPVQSGT